MQRWTVYIITLFLIVFLASSIWHVAEKGVDDQSLFEETVRTYLAPAKLKEDLERIQKREESVKLTATERETLRLAHYAIEQRLDPLFALPGIIPKNYQLSINAVINSKNELRALYDEEHSELIDALYPIDFLEALGTLEEERRALIAYPTRDVVNTYHRRLLHTMDTYKENLDGLIAALRLVDDDVWSDGNIGFHTGNSSSTYIKEVLIYLRNQTEGQKKKAEQRFACFQGDRKSCARVTIPALPTRGNMSSSERVVPQHIKANSALVRAIRTNTLATVQDDITLMVLPDNACVTQYRPAYYVPWSREGTSGVAVFHPELVNDIVLYDMKDGKQSMWEYSKTLLARGGGPYVFLSTSAHYICPDLTADQVRLKNIEYVLMQYIQTKIDSEDSILSPYLTKLRGLYSDIEQTLPIVYEVDVSQYVSTIRDMLKEYGEVIVARELGEDLAERLTEIVSTYASGSYEYSELILNGLWDNSAVREYTYHGTETTLQEMFYIRSFPMLFFHVANSSIVPIPVSFVQSPRAEFPPHVIIHDQISDLYTEDEWKSMLTKSAAVEVEMGIEAGSAYVIPLQVAE